MSSFHCTKCGACCSNLNQDQSVIVLSGDLAKISDKKSISHKSALMMYCIESEALSIKLKRPVFELKSTDGRCVFLEDNNGCSIHEYKPLQCKLGPTGLLPYEMKKNYDCMKGIVINEKDDYTLDFMGLLLEDHMPSSPIPSIGVALDQAQSKILKEKFKHLHDLSENEPTTRQKGPKEKLPSDE